MDRREFLAASGGGFGLICLPSLPGCKATGASDSFDPGPYRVGDERLVLDEAGEPVALDADARALVEADGDVAARSAGQMPGSGPGEWNLAIDACADEKGQLYVLDHGNSHVHVYSPDGAYMGAISGHGSGPGDLNMPQDLHVHEGRIYVCDTLNHRVQVFDDNGERVFCCEGGEDGLNAPRCLAFASNGELHVVDSGNARVQVFDAGGRPLRSYGGYGTEPGKLLSPRSITAAKGGRMVIADATSGWISVYTEAGEFVGRFRPMDDAGQVAVPLGVTELADGTLYVYAGGLRAFQTVAG